MKDIYNKTNSKIRSSINASEYRIMYSFVGTLLLVTILSFIILSSSTANGEVASFTSTSNASVTVASTCSMTATVDTDHSAIIANGTYRAGIGQTTIKTFCNDPDGYAIYAIGYTGGDAGVTAGTNTKLHSVVLGDDYDINTGTTESGDTSSWAMKLSAVTAESSGTSQPYSPSILNEYGAYHAVPSNYAKVASFSSMTDNKGGIGSSLTTTYAAYVSGTQPAGTYTGQVKYILVHPSSHLNPSTYYMQEVNLWGSSVRVGEEVTAYDSRDNKSYTVARLCMEGYNSTTGACESSMLWMTQNLDLDLSTSTPLNSVNTDLNTYGSSIYTTATGYSKDANGTIYWTPANSTIDGSASETSSYTITGWTDSNTAPSSLNPGNWYMTNGYFDSELCRINEDSQTCNYLTKASNTYKKYFATEATASADPDFGTIDSHRHVGNYYNWNASVATNNSSAITAKYDNAANSICPKGWRLPKITSSDTSGNEFAQLNQSYNPNYGSGNERDKGLLSAPFYGVRAGDISNLGSLNSAGRYGLYWFSTAYDDARTFELTFRSGNVVLNDVDYRHFAFSLRCVAREEKAIDEVNTMQEFATMSPERKSAVVASMATDHQYQLTDERDSKVYWVSKMKDGKVWMTQALDLDLNNGTVLTHNTSDIGWTEDNENKTWDPAASANTIQFEGGAGTTVSGWTNDNDAPYSASAYYGSNGNDVYIMSSGVQGTADTVTNLAGCTGTGKSAAECAHYKVGNYYNFAAANASNSVAGTIGHTLTDADDYTVMPDSICPAGWRMPHGLLSAPTSGVASANNSEFDTLLYTYGITPKTGAAKSEDVGFTSTGSTAVRVSPLYFVRSGRVDGGTLYDRGTNGNSWSSTISATSNGYRLEFNATAVYLAANYYRLRGFPVRCILR